MHHDRTLQRAKKKSGAQKPGARRTRQLTADDLQRTTDNPVKPFESKNKSFRFIHPCSMFHPHHPLTSFPPPVLRGRVREGACDGWHRPRNITQRLAQHLLKTPMSRGRSSSYL